MCWILSLISGSLTQNSHWPSVRLTNGHSASMLGNFTDTRLESRFLGPIFDRLKYLKCRECRPFLASCEKQHITSTHSSFFCLSLLHLSNVRGKEDTSPYIQENKHTLTYSHSWLTAVVRVCLCARVYVLNHATHTNVRDVPTKDRAIGCKPLCQRL